MFVFLSVFITLIDLGAQIRGAQTWYTIVNFGLNQPLKVFLQSTMDWRASNTSDLGDIHSFALICFFVNFWWTHIVNLLWPVHSCFPWIWKRILIHFSCKSSTSPLTCGTSPPQMIPNWLNPLWKYFTRCFLT